MALKGYFTTKLDAKAAIAKKHHIDINDVSDEILFSPDSMIFLESNTVNRFYNEYYDGQNVYQGIESHYSKDNNVFRFVINHL